MEPEVPGEPLVLSAPGVTPVHRIPAFINKRLRDYQRDGVKVCLPCLPFCSRMFFLPKFPFLVSVFIVQR